MEVTLTENGKFDRELTVRVPAERVRGLWDEELTKLVRMAQIPGFRPGKAPRRMLENRFRASLLTDVAEELVKSTLPEALRQVDAKPIATPELVNVSELALDQEFVYQAAYQVFEGGLTPQGYQGMVLTRPVVTIGEADIDKVMQEVRTAFARHEVEAGWQAQNGDQLLLDFEGMVDGEAFPGGSSQDYLLTLGGGRLLHEFEEQLLGVAAGETRTVTLTFPSVHPNVALSGKEAAFHCTVKEVRRSILPESDDKVAELTGFADKGGLAALHDDIRTRLTSQMEAEIKRQLREQVLEGLLAANRQELPGKLVEMEFQELVKNAKEEMKESGMDLDKAGFDDDYWKNRYGAAAQDRVILGLAVRAISDKEGLEPTREAMDAYLDHTLEREANLQPMREQLRANRDFMQQIRAALIEQNVEQWIVDHGQVTDKPTSFEELMTRKGGPQQELVTA